MVLLASGRRAALRFLPLVLLQLALCAAGPAKAAPVAVLVYHRFDAVRPAATTVTTATFQGQLDWLRSHGWRIVPLKDAVAGLEGRSPADSGPAAAVTVDDGHESVYTELFPLIRRERIPVTLFIYPSAISNASYALTWAQLREMQASGLVDVESHTYWHPNFRTERRRLSRAGYQAFVGVQLGRARAMLAARAGAPAELLAWPFGIVDGELEAAAKKAGYRAAFAYEGGLARPGGDLFAIPRIPVSEADRGDRFAARLQAAGRERAR